MDARTILYKQRIGKELSKDDTAWFADAIATGEATDAQVGAFAMGTCLRGMSVDARVALTLGMRDSGDTLAWDLPGPVVDKHSTGGLGDSVSLLLAPALAACGVYNPMISGRGLGHTGGTLDKLEAIPGFKVDQSERAFRKIVKDVGTAIVSASGNLAPADKRLYAIRDVTSTVESIDLITASILSKKLAAGLEHLVLDVKTGSGGFMKTEEDARALARSLVDTANGAGCKTTALLTDMNEPLMGAVGNALEIAEVMRALTGRATDDRILDVTKALGAILLDQATDRKDGADRMASALESGKAAEVFGRMVSAQGGPTDFVENWRAYQPEASVIVEVPSPVSGSVAAIDGVSMGMVVVRLGGGRLRDGDDIDHAVGLTDVVRIGAKVGKGDPLARVHARDEASATEASEALMACFALTGEAVAPPNLLLGEVT